MKKYLIWFPLCGIALTTYNEMKSHKYFKFYMAFQIACFISLVVYPLIFSYVVIHPF